MGGHQSRRQPTAASQTPANRTPTPADLHGGRGNGHANQQLQQGTGPAAYHRPDDLSQLTPAYVEAHREELGISPNTPTEDFFNEFVAHQVTGNAGRRSDHVARMHGLENAAPQDLTPEQQQELDLWRQESGMLLAWGYDPNVTAEQEVMDDETGLYAVRYDPTAEGRTDGRRSITSFRGTQPDEGILDFATDADDYVGQAQYENNAEAISSLVRGGTEDSTVTGHSLGGYLAQRAAVDNHPDLGQVVTFQSGGLGAEEAQRFDATNQGTAVRHHTQEYDFVHMGGEQRLDGQTFHHHTNRVHFDHVHGMMFGSDSGQEGVLGVAPSDGVDEGVEHNWDPHIHRRVEAARRGIGSTARHGAAMVVDNVDSVAGGVSSGIDHASQGLDRAGAILSSDASASDQAGALLQTAFDTEAALRDDVGTTSARVGSTIRRRTGQMSEDVRTGAELAYEDAQQTAREGVDWLQDAARDPSAAARDAWSGIESGAAELFTEGQRGWASLWN